MSANAALSALGPYPTHSFAARPLQLPDRTLTRFETFIGGRYSQWNLSSLLYADRRGKESVKMEAWSAHGRSKPTFEEAKKALEGGKGKECGIGFKFGPSCESLETVLSLPSVDNLPVQALYPGRPLMMSLGTNHWIKMTMTIPPSWKKSEQVELIFDPSCEGMIFDESGLALQGITGGNDYNRRVEYIISKAEVDSGKCVRFIEISANAMFGNDQDPVRDDVYYTLVTADIGSVNLEARRLQWDFQLLHELATTMPENSPLRHKARYTANEIMNTFQGTLESVTACRKVAEDILGSKWETELAKSSAKGKEEGTLWALSYCHIDNAWLWPWSATQQKIARSWSSTMDLMERYPEFRFMASSAQQYKWLEQLYPKLFKKLQEKIKSGQFEVVGGTWLEMDGNMCSGESMCRQFLLGQGYFRSRFGKTADVLVLPDTFGLSASLPQIARLSGAHGFVTQKLSWSETNTFPLTHYNWVGIDGTQLLTHEIPILRYDSLCTVEEIRRGYTEHHNMDVCSDSLLLYGNGDGGGGAQPQMIEKLRRTRAAALKHDRSGGELPLVKMGISLGEFFENLRVKTKNGSTLPDWDDELYLERHRGCQTSQGRTKRGNRKGENLLRETELLSTLASIYGNYSYPKEAIDDLWELLCRNQFHDSLPGSSIGLAVVDYMEAFAQIQKKGHKLLDAALKALVSSSQDSESRYALNTLHGQARREVVAMPGGGSGLAEVSRDQLSSEIDQSIEPIRAVTVNRIKGGYTLSNSSLSVTITGGRITSIFDHAEKRELVRKGQTAGFNLYEDMPNGSDAWDVDPHHLEKYKKLEFETVNIVESSSLRATVECKIRIGQSLMTTKISLDSLPASLKADSRSLIRFECEVDWHERHQFLKFELPTTLRSRHATYDQAFGVLKRQTTRNNSWEAAKFEVAAHKFADLSDAGYGVALLNDCKYGYGVHGSTMRLSLLRGPTTPDQEADQGKNEFAFAIYPHMGTYETSDVQSVAHGFNNPMKVIREPITAFKTFPFVVENAPNVILETIKRGEEDFDAFTRAEVGKSGMRSKLFGSKGKTVVLRLFEHMGGRAKARLTIRGVSASRVILTNVIEDTLEELVVSKDKDGQSVELEFGAFEIKTVKLYL